MRPNPLTYISLPKASHRQPYETIVRSTIIMTVMGLAAACLSFYSIERHLVEAAGQTMVLAAEEGARRLDHYLEERHGDLTVLARSRIVRGGDPTAVTAHLRYLQETYTGYAALAMADQTGKIVAGTAPTLIGQRADTERWFQAAQSARALIVFDARPTAEAGGMTAVTIAAPVYAHDGSFLGVVAGWIGVPYLEDLLKETTEVLKSQRGAEARIEYMLLSVRGDLLADSIFRQEGTANLQRLGVTSALAIGESGSGFVEEEHGRAGIDVVTGYAQTRGSLHLRSLNWGVMIRVDRDSVRAPIISLLSKLGLGGLSIAVPMVLLLLWSAKRLEQAAQEESSRATSSEEALHLHIASLRSLVDAARWLTVTQDLDEMLQNLLTIARTQTGSAHAVIGLLDEAGSQFARVIAHEQSGEILTIVEQSAIGRALIEQMTRSEGPIRLANLSHHLAHMGFPAPDLHIAGFLGVPIRAHNRLFGRLCLMNKTTTDGRSAEFTDLDEQVVVALTAQASISVENLKALEQAKRQATHDSLTGLLNHSAALEVLGTELERARRSGEPITVMIADLDHFKAVNDTYGHATGDQVLIESAHRLRGIVRPYDYVGRVGGEEFLLVLPNCDAEGGGHMAERVRRAIGDRPYARTAGAFTVTISIGLITWDTPLPTSQKALIELADQALYRAKKEGRDRVAVAQPRVYEPPERLAS